jgi:hypothetical protein
LPLFLLVIAGGLDVLEKVNYFLYVVGISNMKKSLHHGECGVGFTALRPSITDAPYGTLYIAPALYAKNGSILINVSPYTIKKHVLSYYNSE